MRREGMPDVPPEIPVEVVPPSAGGRALPHGGGSGGEGRAPGDGAKPAGPVTAFHPAAAGLMILIDSLWGIPEFAVLTWPVTVVGCFLSVFVPSYLIQRRSHGDTVGMAFLKAVFLGGVAAVPLPIMGTSIGLALLAWFGIKSPRR
jgi:hypothetical protein